LITANQEDLGKLLTAEMVGTFHPLCLTESVCVCELCWNEQV